MNDKKSKQKTIAYAGILTTTIILAYFILSNTFSAYPDPRMTAWHSLGGGARSLLITIFIVVFLVLVVRRLADKRKQPAAGAPGEEKQEKKKDTWREERDWQHEWRSEFWRFVEDHRGEVVTVANFIAERHITDPKQIAYYRDLGRNGLLSDLKDNPNFVIEVTYRLWQPRSGDETK